MFVGMEVASSPSGGLQTSLSIPPRVSVFKHFQSALTPVQAQAVVMGVIARAMDTATTEGGFICKSRLMFDILRKVGYPDSIISSAVDRMKRRYRVVSLLGSSVADWLVKMPKI